MSNQKDHGSMKNLDRCYSAVLQSSTKGISAVEIAKQLGKHRTSVHKYLNTLEYMGKVENEHGIYRVKTGEQTIKPLEKEIVIEFPLPKDQLLATALLEIQAKDCERVKFLQLAETYRTLLEKLRETRTIKIRGKNVDDLDLEKIQNLILQVNHKGSKIDFKGLLKSLRKSPNENKNMRHHALASPLQKEQHGFSYSSTKPQSSET